MLKSSFYYIIQISFVKDHQHYYQHNWNFYLKKDHFFSLFAVVVAAAATAPVGGRCGGIVNRFAKNKSNLVDDISVEFLCVLIDGTYWYRQRVVMIVHLLLW